MILLGLKKRLQNTRLTEKEKQELLLEIDRLEKIVGF